MLLFFLAELYVAREFGFSMLSLYAFLVCPCTKNAILCLNLLAYASRSEDEHSLVKNCGICVCDA